MLDSIKWKELENLSRAQERILSDLICSLACDSLHAPSFTIQQTTNNVVINYNGQDWIIDLSPYNNIYIHPEYPPINLAGGTLSFVSSLESDETGHLIAAESTEIALYDIISEDLDITGGELSVLSGVEISLKDILDSNTGTFVKINKNAKGLVTGSTPVVWNDLATLGAIKLTSLSSTATGISYDNLTGVFSLTSNYTIPTNTAIQTWNTAASWGNHALQGYATTTWVNSNFVNLTGTYSNPIWLTSLAWSKLTGIPSATTAISGILSSSDWNVFNNKQALLESGTNIKTINSSSILGTGDLLVGGVSIKNNAGTLQWTTTDGNKDIRFAGSGDTSISFNSTTRTVTITSIPGAGGGGVVTSFNGRVGAVVSEEGDYNLSHLGDVDITGIIDLQILQYSSVSSNFINKTLDTSIVPENGNLYYTNSRARSAISATGSLSYNSSTGVISYTTPTNLSSFTNDSSFITLLALSAGTGIAYDNLTGIITNTAPDKTVTFTNGAGIAVTGTYPNFTVSSSITQYTDGAARAAISLSVTGTSGNAAYNNTTGVLTIPGYTLAGLGGISFSSLLTSYALGSNAALTTADTLIGAFGKIQGQLNAKQNTLTPGALTKADDTNVTLTLGGTPSTALLQAASLTLGWTGQLSVARGGTGASSLTGIIVGTGTATLAGITGTTNQVLRKTTTGYEFYTLANESDPIFIASPAFGITATNITNWNTAYSTNHVAVTLGTNTNGLSLVGQTLSLDLATSLLAGAMSKDDKIKLDSLTNYSLPTASSTILGGVKIGTNISVDVNGVISVTFPTAYTLPIATDSILGGVKLTTTTAQATTPTAVSNTASRTYSIQMNGSSQLVVNVPWTDTIYSHPVQTAISYTNTGASIVSGVTVNTLGHVTAISSRTLTLSDLGYTAYTHPSGDGNLHVPATLTSNNGKALIAGASAGSLSWGTPWTDMGYLTSFTESDPIFLAWSTTSRTAKTFYAAPNAADGVASFRLIVASDIPILNQNTTGSAAKWTIARNLAGNLVDGSANVLFANKFIVQGTTDTGLSGAQFLGALATGIVKNTTNTGVLSIATIGTDYTLLNGSGYVKMTGTTPAYVASIPIADLTASSITINGSSVSLGGSLSVTSNTTNNFVFKSGTALTPTEGTDIYTFNGNAAKSINLQAGTNVTLTNSAGIITINANDTSVAWGEVTGKPTTFAPSAHTLDSHSNVAITSISSNHLLKWDGSAWINFSPTWTSNIGTVTSVSVTTANGISGTVATPTTTPAITLSLGDITPTKVNGIVFSGSATPSLAISGTSTISGSNTGDNAINTLYSGLVSNATHTGDAIGTTALSVVGLRNVALPTLTGASGFLKYTGSIWSFDTSTYLTSYIESDPIFLAWKNDNTLTANKVWASPSGVTGTASFRLLAAADIPNLDTAKITSGTFSDVRIASASNWNTAFGWGNHSGLYSLLGHTHTLSQISDYSQAAVNYWTLSGSDVYRNTGNVAVGGNTTGYGLFSTQKIGTGVVPHYILNSGSATIGDGASIDFNGSATYLGATTPSVRLSMVREGTAASGYFAISTRNSSSILNEWLRVTSTGNVGIGTTNPATKLHIVESAPIVRLTSTNDFYYTDYGIGYIDSRTNTNGVSSFALKTGGVDRFFIHTNGNVSIGSTTDTNFAKLQLTGAISSSTLTANTLLKSDSNKVITSVVQADVTGLLSDFYIKNQTSVQTANFNISGYGIIDSIKIHRNGVLNNTFIGAAGTGSGSTGTFNTVVGYNSLSASSSGAGNTVVGYASLLTNTTGAYNSTLGTLALTTNTIGDHNVAIGYATMYNSTTAGRNIAIGYYTARYLGNTASATVISGYNIAMGWSTMNGNTTDTTLNIGNYNVAIGFQALYLNESGSNNNVIGNGAGHDNKIGIYNVFLGASSGYTSKASGYNTGVGTNTFRYYNDSETTTQGYNVAIGYRALEGSAVAANNIFTYTTAVGVSSGLSLTSGSYNTFLGYSAGSSVTTGGYNILIGRNAGSSITTGIGNVLLGGHGGSQIATINNWMLFSDGNGTYRYQVSNNGRLIIKGTAGSDNGFGDLQVNGTIWTSSIAANSLVKTNADKTLVAVTGADIAGALGTSASGNYIQNGTTLQTANFNISSNGLIGGNLGIGVSTAYEQLEVGRTTNGGRMIVSDGGSAERYGLVFVSPVASRTYARIFAYKYGTGTGGINLILNDSGGNVGIGTTTPDIGSTGNKVLTVSGTFTRARLQLQNTDGVSVGSTAGTVQFIGGTVAIADITATSITAVNSGFLAFSTNNAGSYSEKMRILPNGRFLVGTTSEIGGNTHKFQVDSGSTTGNGIYVNGKIFSTDNIQSYSDRAKKSNIQDLILNDKLQKLQLQSYVINGHKSLGFIAQDIQPLFPELVGMENGFLTLDYNAIGSLGLGLSIENKNEIETLKERIKVLEEEIERLK